MIDNTKDRHAMLRHRAALEAQQALVDEWESQHGAFTEEELGPFLERIVRAQVNNSVRVLKVARSRLARKKT